MPPNESNPRSACSHGTRLALMTTMGACGGRSEWSCGFKEEELELGSGGGCDWGGGGRERSADLDGMAADPMPPGHGSLFNSSGVDRVEQEGIRHVEPLLGDAFLDPRLPAIYVLVHIRVMLSCCLR